MCLGGVVAGSSPKGDMVFLTVFLLQCRRLDIETHFINSFTFSPILLSCFLVRGRSIGLGQGLNWLRPGWTYPSRPPPMCPLHRQRGISQQSTKELESKYGEQVRSRAEFGFKSRRVQVQMWVRIRSRVEESVELSSRCLELLPSLCDGRGWWGWKKRGEIKEFIRGRE